jgi:carotenoid cleavage dioxygenase-like enzyme
MDHAPLLERALFAMPPEDSYAADRIEGEIPRQLRGTLYLNGPARFTRGSLRYRHWLDGDGLLCAVRFEARGVHVTHRFVRTEKTIQEDAEGRPIFRTFGTAFAGDRLHRGVALESPANVSVVPFAGTLLACGEQGLPYALDPITLETSGAFTFRDSLTDITPFAAHPKRDPATGQLLNFGISFSAVHPTLNVYAFAPDATLAWRRRVPLDHPRSIHDFAVTARHVLFYLSPYLLDARAIVQDGRTAMDALSWRPDLGSRLLVLSRESGEVVASVPVGACFCLHAINAFEDGDAVVFDVIEYERPIYEQYRDLPDLFRDVGRGRPIRFVIDPRSGVIRERVSIDYSLAPDFPAADPALSGRAYGEFWMLGISATGRPGRKFFDELLRADWASPARPDVHRLPPGRFFAGEPAIVADAAGGTPLLLVPICDPARGRSSIAVYDAHDLREPIASVELRHLLPPLFHSAFAA